MRLLQSSVGYGGTSFANSDDIEDHMRHPSLITRYSALSLFAAIAVCAQPAAAQTSAGIRAGVSADPDQFYFGGHVETQPLVEQLRFRPNVEIGIGDDITTVALNVEFAYHFRQPGRTWNIYAGAGPALNIIDSERDTDVGGGFNILVGVTHTAGLFFEFKVGVVDSPGVKFGVGYTFR
jgi:hypothetical protein